MKQQIVSMHGGLNKWSPCCIWHFQTFFSVKSFIFSFKFYWTLFLTHWGRATHICVSKFSIIASDNGLSPGRRQAIIWNNAGISSIGLLGTNFSEILIGIQIFSFKKMYLKVSSAKCRPFCLGLNMLKVQLTLCHGWCRYRRGASTCHLRNVG